MSGAADETRYVLLWWGENATDWEIEFWQHIKQSHGFAGTRAADHLFEAYSHEEWEEKHDHLVAEGWQYTSTGSGGLSRVSVYQKIMTHTQPFDPLAPTYDDTFTDTPIGRYLRGRVQARLDTRFQPGDHVLELGCGTGEDALHLARRGVRVLATDSSAAMLAVAREKTAGEPLVEVSYLDIRTHGDAPLRSESESFDGVFANFGPVNVLQDRRPLAKWLAGQVKPGGVVGMGVMGPLCLWEMAWHGLHLDFNTALRRLNGQAMFQAEDAVPLPVYYPTIARLERDFAPHFRRVHLEALGLFLPPSDVYGVIEKRPRLLHTLTALEQRFAGIAPLARFADHYWIEFERL